VKTGKKMLVVYYSLSGNTERVAQDLAKRLGADLEKLGDLKNRRGPLGYLRAVIDSIRERPAELADIGKHARDYDLTIVGTPIWGGKITPAMRSYLRTIRGRCNDIAFFTTSGSTPAVKVTPDMERLAGRPAVAFSGFNYDELKSEAQYDDKIIAFIGALQGKASSSVDERPGSHAAA